MAVPATKSIRLIFLVIAVVAVTAAARQSVLDRGARDQGSRVVSLPITIPVEIIEVGEAPRVHEVRLER